MPEKKISFPVTEEEHGKIKRLAKKERRTIKLLVLEAFDRLYPEWNKDNEDKRNDK